MVELFPEDAALALDMAALLSGPMSAEDAVELLLQGRYLVPKLEAAFEAAGIDPETIERPELPKMVPGSKAKNAST